MRTLGVTGGAVAVALAAAVSVSGTVERRQAAGATAAPEADVRAIVRQMDPANIETTIRKLVSFGTRSTLSSQTDPNRGVGAARDWLYAEYRRIAEQSGGRLRVSLQTFTQPAGTEMPAPTQLTNVVAILPGERFTPQQRVYVVSGHYDSRCSNPTDGVHDAPGADDDGSGTAAVLEMARVMSRYRFDAPIVFVAVTGEEEGLYGSQHFAQEAQRDGWRVRAMFTNDIIGASLGGNGARDAHSVRLFSEGIPSNETPAQAAVRKSVGGENDGPSRQLARYIKESAEQYVPGMTVRMIYRRDRYGRGGDHIPFLTHGYPAVRFTEPNEDFNHQHQDVRTVDGVTFGDLPEFVDFAYTAQVARVNAAALAMLATAPDTPDGAGIAGSLSDDTTLVWSVSDDPQIAGYEVVWRDTDAPQWRHARPVGKVTRYTVRGLSKDNYLFGVRAVDRRGRRGPVAYPRPVRDRPVTAAQSASSNR